MPQIHRTVIALLLAAGTATAAHAEVWKCTIDGKTHYSDQPCPSTGQAMKSQSLQGNVIDTASDRAAADRAKAAADADRQSASVPAAATATTGGTCPSDRDITGMETKANSISLSPEAKRFIQDEVRRARQCQKGQGTYSSSDWNVSKQAVDAQSSLTGGDDARRRAEAMHSAANASEGDRIARQRENEEREAARRQRLEQRNR